MSLQALWALTRWGARNYYYYRLQKNVRFCIVTVKTYAVILQTFLASVESTQCILFGGSFQENLTLLSAVVTVKCKC